jgi:hypothetical protein
MPGYQYKILHCYLWCDYEKYGGEELDYINAALIQTPTSYIMSKKYFQLYAIFCCRVAAWVQHMFFDFYLVVNHKIVTNSTATGAIKKEVLIWKSP